MNNQMIPLTVANTLDQSVKQRIEARGQQTVKQAVQEAKMAPQGQFDVFDGLGKVVSNQPVDQFRDKTIYIGVQKVAGGGAGIPLDRLKELRVEFPSIRPVRQYTDGTKTDMVVLQFPSGVRTSSGFWRVAILSNGKGYTPFILNKTEVIQGTSPFVRGETVIPGTNNTGLGICQGGIMAVLNHLSKDPVARMGAYINHVQNLLNE
jgi:hypothetical protein